MTTRFPDRSVASHSQPCNCEIDEMVTLPVAMLRPPLTKFAADQSRTDRQALAVLARQPHRNSSDYLFGERAFNNWDRCKQEVDQRAGIAPYRLHDLRRACATMLGEIGVQPHHIEAILNHYSGHRSGVAGVYQRAKYADKMRSALQRWADHLDQITA